MIERESWKIIEMIIRRYPYKKKEYEDYIDAVMASSGNKSCGVQEDDYTKPQSLTEAKALKMTSVYADKIKREIDAVEYVYYTLNSEEQKVMRERFWTERKRNIPYLNMTSSNYSERQMKRIVYKIIVMVGKYLGEIN